MSLNKILRGTGVAIVTPFKSDFSIDYDALSNIIEFQITGGVEYIVTLGTTGETPTLSKDEKKKIILHTYEKVNGRVPVVVGIGGNNTHEVISELQSFPLDRCTAILSAGPYYNKPSQEGLFFHYKALAEASPKPILLYNVPARTGKNITAETTLRLAHEVSNIGGIKEASGDIMQCTRILRDKPNDFLVVSGDDSLALPLIACGMEGVISVASNAFPKKFSNMIRLCLKGDFQAAAAVNTSFHEACELMFEENNPAGVKCFMAEAGLIENIMRLPVVPVSEGLQARIRNYCSKQQ